MLDWTRTISPSLVNEARAGVNYVFINNGAAGNGLTNLPRPSGIPGVPSSFLPSMSFTGGNVASFGNQRRVPAFRRHRRFSYEDTLIWTKGTHTMHFGFQGYRYRMDTFYSGNNGEAGTFLFNGQYTAGVAIGWNQGRRTAAVSPKRTSCWAFPTKFRAASTAAPGASAPILWPRSSRTTGASRPNLTLNLACAGNCTRLG